MGDWLIRSESEERGSLSAQEQPAFVCAERVRCEAISAQLAFSELDAEMRAGESDARVH